MYSEAGVPANGCDGCKRPDRMGDVFVELPLTGRFVEFCMDDLDANEIEMDL